MKIEFRKAIASQSRILSDLAIESKGHWGYSRAQLDAWRKDLRIEEEYIETHDVSIILADGLLVGFLAIKGGRDDAILDHLWLLPEAIGKGIGKQAFQEIARKCCDRGIAELAIVSDPDAEGFYLKQGAKRIGQIESIPQNRMLPKLNYMIGQTGTTGEAMVRSR